MTMLRAHSGCVNGATTTLTFTAACGDGHRGYQTLDKRIRETDFNAEVEAL